MPELSLTEHPRSTRSATVAYAARAGEAVPPVSTIVAACWVGAGARVGPGDRLRITRCSRSTRARFVFLPFIYEYSVCVTLRDFFCEIGESHELHPSVDDQPAIVVHPCQNDEAASMDSSLVIPQQGGASPPAQPSSPSPAYSRTLPQTRRPESQPPSKS